MARLSGSVEVALEGHALKACKLQRELCWRNLGRNHLESHGVFTAPALTGIRCEERKELAVSVILECIHSGTNDGPAPPLAYMRNVRS